MDDAWNGIRHPDLGREPRSSNLPDLSQTLTSVPTPLRAIVFSFLNAYEIFTWSYKIKGGRKSRFTVVYMGNNTIINNNNTRINCFRSSQL